METVAHEVSHVERVAAVAADVREGLLARPKRLPPWLFYDATGSALFEEITRLPEYYPTRTERAILERHAGEMVEAAGTPASLVELGAGSASKTRVIIAALLARRPDAAFMPVDVSPTALAGAARHLRAGFPTLAVTPVVAKYPDELGFLRSAPSPRLLLFLGSNIGNYEPDEGLGLLSAIHRRLRPSDSLLLATDMRKDPGLLVPAYDDAAGVTARFNRNVLAVINRELDADFDVESFEHIAVWDDREQWIEMRLRARGAQQVHIADLDLSVALADGEEIRTEISAKFTPDRVRAELGAAGLGVRHWWTDAAGRFALSLAAR
jgi:L-histidine N-alpha-methyltransferase